MSSEEVWFYEKSGERNGPIDSTKLVQLFESGDITSETLVWKEGMSDWTPFNRCELATEEEILSPPPVPKREVVASTDSGGSEPQGVLQPVAAAEIPRREAILNEDYQIGIRSSLGKAWDLMKSDFWPYVGLFALTLILLSVASQLMIPIFFLMYPIMVGFNWYALRRIRGEVASIDDLFFGFKRGFGGLAVLNLLIMLPFLFVIMLIYVVAIGLIIFAAESGGGGEEIAAVILVALIVVGGIFVTLAGSLVTMIGYFASLLVVDCDWPWKRALSEAWRFCKNNLWKIILFYIVMSLLSVLGMLALYVGIFVTGAWGAIAVSQIYEDAFGDVKRDPVS